MTRFCSLRIRSYSLVLRLLSSYYHYTVKCFTNNHLHLISSFLSYGCHNILFTWKYTKRLSSQIKRKNRTHLTFLWIYLYVVLYSISDLGLFHLFKKILLFLEWAPKCKETWILLEYSVTEIKFIFFLYFVQ